MLQATPRGCALELAVAGVTSIGSRSLVSLNVTCGRTRQHGMLDGYNAIISGEGARGRTSGSHRAHRTWARSPSTVRLKAPPSRRLHSAHCGASAEMGPTSVKFRRRRQEAAAAKAGVG